jgi:tRNA 2-selenouridine synthase
MQEIISAEQFLKEKCHFPVIDVRSPGEYETGHIPAAINIPVFNNEERAIVGTTYTKIGTSEAIEKGQELAAAKLDLYTDSLQHVAPQKKALMYCWRGGMRSREMARFYESGGFEIRVLQGGYKAYRTYIRQQFSRPADIRIVGGYTGTGKTEILTDLKKIGCQIIDLEDLANHKGSVFGHLGQKNQPTSQNFENELFEIWNNLDPDKPVWIEHESMNVGNIYLPDTLYQNILHGKLFFVKVSKERRVQRILKEYAGFPVEDLIYSLKRIERRIGPDVTLRLTDLLLKHQFEKVTDELLVYYDKTYQNAALKNQVNQILELDAVGLESDEIATLLMEYKV